MKKSKLPLISFAILTLGFVTAAIVLLVTALNKPSDSSENPSSESHAVDTESTPVVAPPSEPEVPKIEFEPSEDPSFFDDALFIGDSRTVGLSTYSDIGEGTAFANIGLNINTARTNSLDVKGFGKTTLSNLLANRKFAKIYIMFGVNELGFLSPESIKASYQILIDEIRTVQPDAVIFLGACIKVTNKYSNANPNRSNTRIDILNSEISTLADGNFVRYVDPNPLFTDEYGNLMSTLSGDGIHLYAKVYSDLTLWLSTDALN